MVFAFVTLNVRCCAYRDTLGGWSLLERFAMASWSPRSRLHHNNIGLVPFETQKPALGLRTYGRTMDDSLREV